MPGRTASTNHHRPARGNELPVIELTHVPHVYYMHCMRPQTTKSFVLHSLPLRVWLTPTPGKLVISYLSQNANAFKTNLRVPGLTSFGCFMHG